MLRGGIAIGASPSKGEGASGAFGSQLKGLLGGAAVFAKAIGQRGDLYSGLGGEQGEEEERGGEEVFHDRAVDCDIR